MRKDFLLTHTCVGLAPHETPGAAEQATIPFLGDFNSKGKKPEGELTALGS